MREAAVGERSVLTVLRLATGVLLACSEETGDPTAPVDRFGVPCSAPLKRLRSGRFQGERISMLNLPGDWMQISRSPGG